MVKLSEQSDKAIEHWLDTLDGQYKEKCRSAFKKFITYLQEKQGWSEVSGDLIIERHTENRKSSDNKTKYYFDDLIPSFITWYESKGVSHNFVLVQASMVRAFFKHHREPLQVQGKMSFDEVDKRYHAYKKDELVKMVQVASLEEKAVIMLGVQLGLRVGDFVALKRKMIKEAYQDADGEFPLEFEVLTEKEKVVSTGHITREVYDILQLYWASAPKSEYSFPSNGGHISEQRGNDILKNCWKKAFPDRKDAKIRFHELRSYKISMLSNAGVNESHIKMMTGKKVPKDMKVYLTGVELKESFLKAEQALILTQTNGNNHKKLEELEGKNTRLETTVRTLVEQFEKEKTVRENTEKAFNRVVDTLVGDIKELNQKISALEDEDGERNSKKPLFDSKEEN